MSSRPRISLCVPTYNRADCVRGALLSGLREAASLPPGTAEVLVCNNASPDGGATEAVIAELLAEHPDLRAFRNETNIGFDFNYLRLVDEARGEFVWILGDDDAWLPGSVARVLQELDAGADACLCLAQACDLNMVPQRVWDWFIGPEPPRVWRLETREDLIEYFNQCSANAGVFAFISVGIYRRDRYLAHREALVGYIRSHIGGYIHVLGMLRFLMEPARLHYIPEPLILNRVDPTWALPGRYDRWMFDLREWASMADHVFPDDPELRRAFGAIVGRNHHNSFPHGLRLHAETEARWQEAVPFLLRAGISPARIAAVEYCHQVLFQNRIPSPHLNAATLCLADLAMVCRGARRIAVLALGGLEDLFRGAPLLASLRATGREPRVLATAEGASYLFGLEVQCLDPARYVRDLPYRKEEVQALVDYAPELIINLDRNRELWGDDLVNAAQPPGALAFKLPDRGQAAELVREVNDGYHCLLDREAPLSAILETLGLEATDSSLWPSPMALREAKAHLARLGWDPARTLALIAEPADLLEDAALATDLAEAGRAGWHLVGLRGSGMRDPLDLLLAPWQGQSLNLAGSLNPRAMAALLGHCARFIGGTPLLQAMARACGCRPWQAPSEAAPHP
jgi:abequosyltransferase